ncbi:MAG: hypothetical protein ACRCUE_13005 [Bosea sp. (in: a-proteobacteria)]
MRAIAIMMMLTLAVAACGHREKKAPCSPSDGVTSQQPLAFAPLGNAPILPFELTTDCGPLKSMNPILLDQLPQSVRARP